jgi:hypothetical protein
VLGPSGIVRARRAAWLALKSGASIAWCVPAALTLGTIAGAVAIFVSSKPAGLAALLLALFVREAGRAILRSGRSGQLIVSGFRVSRDEEPGLWQLVDRAAAALEVAGPDELQITVESRVTAYRHHGTLIVAIGLSWLTTTSPDELVAATAHALAEELAGTGSPVAVRLADRLERTRGRVDVSPIGFLWIPYLRAGEWLQREITRCQLSATDLACAAALGRDALAVAQRASARQEPFADYWAANVGTCLVDGFAPPILEGWSPASDGEDAPLDGSLHLRATPRMLERRLLEALFPDTAGDLVDAEWDRIAGAVWLPRMRSELALRDGDLVPFAVDELETVIQAGPPEDHEMPAYDWMDLIADALAVALVDRAGWIPGGPPRGQLTLHHEGYDLLPYALCASMLDGTWDAADWARFVESAGIGDVIVGAGVDVQAQVAESVAVELPEATVVPPGPAREMELSPAPGRERSLAMLALAAVLGLPSGVALMLAATKAPAMAGRVTLVAFGLVVLASLAVVVLSRLRVLRATGTLTVTGQGVRIDHPGLLKQPFEIPREAVRAIVFDEGDWSDSRRFPVGATEHVIPAGFEAGGGVGWLWSADNGLLVPMLGHRGAIPNVALLIDDPTLSPEVRHVTLTGPLPGEALAGLLLAVEDVQATRTAFAPWGRTRIGRGADARHVRDLFLGDEAVTSPPAG